jgi:hypothetical protein
VAQLFVGELPSFAQDLGALFGTNLLGHRDQLSFFDVGVAFDETNQSALARAIGADDGDSIVGAHGQRRHAG